MSASGKALREHMEKLRNIGIIAHIDAGKTTLTERILYYTSKIHRMGEVHEGAATMDFMPEEQERGITIASACSTCEWAGRVINIIDTPGHVDFSIEVERCLRVLDGAVGVFCAVGGVEPQSETVWRQAGRFAIPKMAFINKMDRPGASFKRVMDEIRDTLGVSPVAAALPIGEEDSFEGVIDLVSMERVDFDPATQGREYSRRPLSAGEAAMAAPWREKLVEAAADEDNALMESYLGGGEITPEELIPALRKAVLARRIVPVYGGSALKNIGVQLLLDGIAAFMPNPAEASATEAGELKKGEPTGEKIILPADSEGPLAALVFKLFLEGGRKISFIRIYSGRVSAGMSCFNATRGEAERITRIFRLDADSREPVEEAGAGDIIAVQGLRSVYTGDSITAREKQFLLEDIAAYRPVISVAFEPKNSAEGDKLDEVLARYTLEDPTLKAELDEASGQRVVSGMGELHLEVLRDRIQREYGLSPRVGKPQVVCQESIRKSAEGSGIFDRELGDVPHFGSVALAVSPRERGSGNEVRWGFNTEGWPAQWLAAAAQGVTDSLDSGVLNGYPVQDVLVKIKTLERRDASSPAGYHMAAAAALKDALGAASPMLLEPIMQVEINTPEAYLGAALSLVSTRGGKVESMGERGEQRLIRALAPMRQLFGFATDLRSSTQGRAGLIMRFERFDAI